MEYESAEVVHDKDGKGSRNGASESKRAEIDVKDVLKPIPGSQRNKEQFNVVDQKGAEPVSRSATLGHVDSSGEVNMEATITPDDVIQAGGFGARDDISSFLPVASDSTDSEASIHDAQDYEQSREEVHGPGLGWTEASETM